jgi:GTPase involved in cell partitioning and DNA repair
MMLLLLPCYTMLFFTSSWCLAFVLTTTSQFRLAADAFVSPSPSILLLHHKVDSYTPKSPLVSPSVSALAASTEQTNEHGIASKKNDLSVPSVDILLDDSDSTRSSVTATSSHEYSFYDEATIQVRAGSGGQGASTYKKGVGSQNGPPDGGNGGKGGNVWLIVDDSLNTLAGLNPTAWRPNSFGGSGAARSAQSTNVTTVFKSFRAEMGADGGRQFKNGRSGKDAAIRVPPGTLVQEVIVTEKNGKEDEMLVELGSLMLNDEKNDDESGSYSPLSSSSSKLCVAKGGEGGEGSGINYKSRGVHRPRLPPQGGEKKLLRLTLKLIADVAIVGVPNAGMF